MTCTSEGGGARRMQAKDGTLLNIRARGEKWRGSSWGQSDLMVSPALTRIEIADLQIQISLWLYYRSTLGMWTRCFRCPRFTACNQVSLEGCFDLRTS